MQLKTIEIEFKWLEGSSVKELRSNVLSHLDNHGKPLRWAITAIQPSKIGDCSSQVKVEAVVIVD